MYVRAPIEELAEMDLQGNPIAAVQDPYSFHIIGGRDIVTIATCSTPPIPISMPACW